MHINRTHYNKRYILLLFLLSLFLGCTNNRVQKSIKIENKDWDRDGIKNSIDDCPNKVEDIDGFQDEDGCPDLDNDEDGVLDVDDECSLIPEDIDGFQDEDGCPDLDNDKDGILDIKDECPNEPEVLNGIKDNDGCPDSLDLALKIKRNIYFKHNSYKLYRGSYRSLKRVARKLKQNINKIEMIVVEGNGDDLEKRKLSKQRAWTVMKYLIKRGVPKNKLEYKWYGKNRPRIEINDLLKNSSSRSFSRRDRKVFKKELKKARSSNRRVQFNIIAK